MAKALEIIRFDTDDAVYDYFDKTNIKNKMLMASKSLHRIRTPLEELLDKQKLPHNQSVKVLPDYVEVINQSGLFNVNIKAYYDGRLSTKLSAGKVHAKYDKDPVLFEHLYHYRPTDYDTMSDIINAFLSDVHYTKAHMTDAFNLKDLAIASYITTDKLLDAIEQTQSKSLWDNEEDIKDYVNTHRGWYNRDARYRRNKGRTLTERMTELIEVIHTKGKYKPEYPFKFDNATDELKSLINDVAVDPEYEQFADMFRDTKPGGLVDVGYNFAAIEGTVQRMYKWFVDGFVQTITDNTPIELVPVGESGCRVPDTITASSTEDIDRLEHAATTYDKGVKTQENIVMSEDELNNMITFMRDKFDGTPTKFEFTYVDAPEKDEPHSIISDMASTLEMPEFQDPFTTSGEPKDPFTVPDEPEIKLARVGDYGYVLDEGRIKKMVLSSQANEYLDEVVTCDDCIMQRQTEDDIVVDGSSMINYLGWVRDALRASLVDYDPQFRYTEQ